MIRFHNTREVAEDNRLPPEVSRNVNREIFEGVPPGNLPLSEEHEDAFEVFLRTSSDGYFS